MFNIVLQQKNVTHSTLKQTVKGKERMKVKKYITANNTSMLDNKYLNQDTDVHRAGLGGG